MTKTLKIKITETYLLQCFLIDQDNNSTIITLHDNQQEYVPCVQISQDVIHVCEESEKSIYFIKEWFEEPNNYKMYSFIFQNKEYSVLAEMLFSLIINEFVKKVEKENCIEKTLIEIPQGKEEVLERIYVALEIIGLEGDWMENEEQNENNFDYQQQMEQISHLLDMMEEYDKCQRMLQRAKNIASEKEMKDVEEKLELCQQTIVTFEMMENEIPKHFTISQRNILKLCNIDNYSLFIASRFFESIEDHVNLVQVSRRMRDNMDKYHYNPISADSHIIKFFPNAQTLYLYKHDDEFITGGRIIKYEDWRGRGTKEIERLKKEYSDKSIEFKKIILKSEDLPESCHPTMLNNVLLTPDVFEIPEYVQGIDLNAFSLYGRYLRSLTIPPRTTSFPIGCFDECTNLFSINMTLDENWMICGNKIFNNKKHFNQPIYLPNSIRFIDKKPVNHLTSFEIPTFVTSIDKNCFYNCRFLQKLIIPDSIDKDFDYSFLQTMTSVKELRIPLNETRVVHGNKIFNNKPHFCQSIILPNNITYINDYPCGFVQKFKTPSFVTSLGENCFENWYVLTSLTITSNVKQMPKDCLVNLTELMYLNISMNDDTIIYGNTLYNKGNHLKEYLLLPDSVEYINDEELNDSIIIPSSVTSLEKDCFKNNVMFMNYLSLPATIESIPKECIEKCVCLSKLSIPLNETRVIYGNKLFNNRRHFGQSFNLPTTLDYINNQKVYPLTRLRIPSFVTSLEENCFYMCTDLRELIIPDSLQTIPENLFVHLHNLNSLSVPEKFMLYSDVIFNIIDNCLYSIEIPSAVKKINEKELTPLIIFTIPSNVTKLADYCFAHCKNLIRINGLEHIKEYGKGCFIDSPIIKREIHPMINQSIESYLSSFVTSKEKKYLEKWTGLKCSDVLFDSQYDNWSRKTSLFDKRIIGKKQIIFLIQNEEGEKFGYYLNSEVSSKYYDQVRSDGKSFHFNLKSNGRIISPMKFEYNSLSSFGYNLSSHLDFDLGRFGRIFLYKKDYVQHLSISRSIKTGDFNFNGIEYPFGLKENQFIEKFMIIQMK